MRRNDNQWVSDVRRAEIPAQAMIAEAGLAALLLTTEPADDGVTLLADTLRELAGPRGHVGPPMGPGDLADAGGGTDRAGLERVAFNLKHILSEFAFEISSC